jgi:succinyl-CoA synthetase beta subunit
VSLGLRAVAQLFRHGQSRPAAAAAAAPAGSVTARPETERDLLAFLASHGVGIIPGTVVHSAAEASAAARAVGAPAVLKIASADVAHKTDVGGVALHVSGDAAVESAYGEILRRVAAAKPDARLDGVIVSPMRTGGVEFFVGVLRDPQWGLHIAVGLGGVWVEALQDTSLRLLPVAENDVLEMLDELRGGALLDGYRGAPAVDRPAVARSVVTIGNAAIALGPKLVALEVNPLLASSHGLEALDALCIWE